MSWSELFIECGTTKQIQVQRRERRERVCRRVEHIRDWDGAMEYSMKSYGKECSKEIKRTYCTYIYGTLNYTGCVTVKGTVPSRAQPSLWVELFIPRSSFIFPPAVSWSFPLLENTTHTQKYRWEVVFLSSYKRKTGCNTVTWPSNLRQKRKQNSTHHRNSSLKL